MNLSFFLVAMVLAATAQAQVIPATTSGSSQGISLDLLNEVYMIAAIVAIVLGVGLSALFCYCRMRNACARSHPHSIEDGTIDAATDVALGLGVIVPSTGTSDAIYNVVKRDVDWVRGKQPPSPRRRIGDPIHNSGILSND